jgi:hypothetical protein
MLAMTVLAILTVIYFTWTSVSGWAYRRPWFLLVCGLLVSAFATMVKSIPLVIKEIPKSPWSPSEMDFAAALVDPTLIGLAGGLIAAGVMLKVQIMHATDVQDAKRNLKRSIEALEEVQRADEDLKLVARSLSDEEFWKRLASIKEAHTEALLDKQEAKRDLRKIQVPGLPGDNET